jgi:hypothetical protein
VGTPQEIALLLKTSRDLFTLSYFAYEFLTIGVLVSLQAVEASPRHRLQTKMALARLIQRAAELEVITSDDADRLDAGRKLRNDFSHPSGGVAWTYGMTAPLIKSSHALVAKLFA